MSIGSKNIHYFIHYFKKLYGNQISSPSKWFSTYIIFIAMKPQTEFGHVSNETFRKFIVSAYRQHEQKTTYVKKIW